MEFAKLYALSMSLVLSEKQIEKVLKSICNEYVCRTDNVQLTEVEQRARNMMLVNASIDVPGGVAGEVADKAVLYYAVCCLFPFTNQGKKHPEFTDSLIMSALGIS